MEGLGMELNTVTSRQGLESPFRYEFLKLLVDLEVEEHSIAFLWEEASSLYVMNALYFQLY